MAATTAGQSASNQPHAGNLDTAHDRRVEGRPATASLETKPSFKTSEMAMYVVALLGIIITAAVVDGDDGGADPFNANDALKYITWLTIGYMVARGLAKSGRRHYEDDRR